MITQRLHGQSQTRLYSVLWVSKMKRQQLERTPPLHILCFIIQEPCTRQFSKVNIIEWALSQIRSFGGTSFIVFKPAVVNLLANFFYIL